MGGTALGFQAKRLNKSEYETMYARIARNLCDLASIPTANTERHLHDPEFVRDTLIVTLIPSYRQKADFGDMDVLLQAEPEVIQRIREKTGEVFPDWSGDIYSNGEVTSVGIKVPGGVAQLDIIYTGTDYQRHSAAYSYFAYNDLGNLIGRLAHRMGFKFGHTGLSYTLRDEASNHVYGEYHFDMSHGDILGFLGLDPARYMAGFDKLEDIFEFVASSPYFHPDIYLLDNVNAVSRIRDKKRKTYMTFLDWLEKRGPQETDLVLDAEGKKKFKEFMLRSTMLADHVFADWVQEVQFSHSEAQYAKLFWNGGLVMNWTGLKGKELGEFITEFRTFVEGDSTLSFNEWAILMGCKAKDFTLDFYVNDWKDQKR